MTSRERSLVVLGPAGAGKATLIGCMLFKYGGVDMQMIQNFQDEGISTYEQASKKLKSLNISPTFDTPKHHVTISDMHPAQADCTILVVAADNLQEADQFEDLSNAQQLIVLINKMDAINWSEEQFRGAVENLTTRLGSSGVDLTRISIIPISALSGDNLVSLSPKCTWYKNWTKGRQGGSNSSTTLLENLDISLGC